MQMNFENWVYVKDLWIHKMYVFYSSPNTIRMTNQEYGDGQDLVCMRKCSNARKIIGRETQRGESSL
jgi:hypothetical protein